MYTLPCIYENGLAKDIIKEVDISVFTLSIMNELILVDAHFGKEAR